MAVVREIEPWDALLEEGRADERLVTQARERPARPAPWRCPATCTRRCATASGGSGSRRCTRTRRQALEAAAERPVVVTTGTASGKSLCFNLPMLDVLCSTPRARALYLYPTKALAQDQARALHALQLKALRPAIYDGDTPRAERAAIRKRPTSS